MKILDLTFSSPADNLSCDEALLDQSEFADDGEILRFWEPAEHFVVLGYSNAWKEEVLPQGRGAKTPPIFRRCSGGGTVLQGPGCLNYSLILKIDGIGARHAAPLQGITSTNRFIMERHRKALETLTGKKIAVQGHTDLTLGDLKFSGNSQRRKRRYLLFHGTFLLDFDLSRIDRSLQVPEKQPAYRQDRPHSSFVTNLGLPPARVKKKLAQLWKADEIFAQVPRERIRQLSEQRYSKDEWNLKF